MWEKMSDSLQTLDIFKIHVFMYVQPNQIKHQHFTSGMVSII